ncbi:DUF4255 domain-containing protein [Chloroflexi bacterium TSY]|nr:DUF4255 domain-containing protein [Chloroflexi bacterium TSY]
MIRDLDDTLQRMLETKAPDTSELARAKISFDIPDSEWRAKLQELTVNCYLYDVRQNMEMRTNEPIIQRTTNGMGAVRRKPPARIDCAYCITAWSPATSESVLEEHRLLSQVLMVLLQHRTMPPDVLQGQLVDQIPPYPTVIATPDGIKNQPEFWGVLDQQLKPSLNYIITLAIMLDEEPSEFTRTVEEVIVETDHMEELAK